MQKSNVMKKQKPGEQPDLFDRTLVSNPVTMYPPAECAMCEIGACRIHHVDRSTLIPHKEEVALGPHETFSPPEEVPRRMTYGQWSRLPANSKDIAQVVANVKEGCKETP